jgi:hypothetical protein
VDIPAKPQKQLSMIDPLLFLLSRQLLLLRQSHSTPTFSGLLSLQDAFPHFVPKKNLADFRPSDDPASWRSAALGLTE